MSRKILVVDDQDFLREILAKYLEKKGCSVIRAKDGQECIELVKKEKFDSIFLDLAMPGVDGWSALEEIRKVAPDSQVVLMSGAVNPSEEREELAQGTDFLAKPFTFHSVLDVLKPDKSQLVHRVLVVDDQEALRGMLADFLEQEGFEIEQAQDGQECIAKVQSSKFDIIFMDVRMPQMDGLEAMTKLKEMKIETPVILMSGYGEVASVQDAQDRGAKTFLQKPFKLADALSIIETQSQQPNSPST